MNIQNIQIAPITQQRFFELWKNTMNFETDDINQIYAFFKPYIETVPKLVLGEYYWQIFNNAHPFPKILIAEGAVHKLIPINSEELVDSEPNTLFSFYEPTDLVHVMTFISLVFPILFNLPAEQRKFYNFTIYARIKNHKGEYQWNSLQYPALYFDENDQLLFGMALYTNVHHLIKPDTVPNMTVIDSTKPDKQLFTYYSSDNQKGIEKPYPVTSPREKEIIALLSQGKSSKQIAALLDITKNTVDNHRQRLLKKFGVHSSAELVMKSLAGLS